MEINKNCARPVKVFCKKKLDMKAYSGLIFGKRGGKEGLPKPQEKGIATFIKPLKLWNDCNVYNVSCFLSFIDSGEHLDIKN